MTQVDDPHYKKTVTLDIGGLSLRFRVSQTLFSSQGIDAGTELLLRALQRTGRQPQKVLDLGCGYGPIGVALKASTRTRLYTWSTGTHWRSDMPHKTRC